MTLHDDTADTVEPKRSRWRNPSRVHTVKLRLLVGNVHDGGNDERTIEIPPGGEVTLARHFDAAIVTTHAGRVTGGMCPWLQRVDPPEDGPRGWDRGEIFVVPDHVGGAARPTTQNGARPRRRLED